jgi:hypothetical protein
LALLYGFNSKSISDSIIFAISSLIIILSFHLLHIGKRKQTNHGISAAGPFSLSLWGGLNKTVQEKGNSFSVIEY